MDQEKSASFEEMLNSLEQCVVKLQGQDLTLEQQIDYFTQGMKLAASCEEQLKSAENKIKKIVEEQNNVKIEDCKIEQ
jgi:exodeoxyribonuclease VII small subunit